MKESHLLNLHDLVLSGTILASALKLSKKLSKPGVSPFWVDSQIKDFILSNGGVPSFLGLDGYPFSTCISLNSQVVHGIPTNVPFKLEDIITIDIGVSYNGHCTDAARTFILGNTKSKRVRHMVDTAYTALNCGIPQARPGNKVGDISYAIQKPIFNSKYTTTLEYGGHGIGFKPHSEPFIPNYGQRNTGLQLKEGMCLAIEPILIDGPNKVLQNKEDGWTVYSPNKCLSAHVEDTVVVANPPIILTRTTLNGDTI